MREAASIRLRHGLPALRDLDPELRRVAGWELALSLSIPWVCVSIYILTASLGWWPMAVLAVMLLSFFTYGSISHDLVHRNLGLPRRANDVFLCATELLAIRSGHAYQAAHLHHHARFPADDDIEGAASHMGLTRTLLEGVVLQPRLWWWAMRNGRAPKAWLCGEGIACLGIVTASVVVLQWTFIPLAYVALVVAGSWIIPLVTSYIPHNAHAHEPLQQTRVFRGRLFSWLAIEHLYHLEHHLYPQVPHHHWARLAKRLDPYFARAGIEPIGKQFNQAEQTFDDEAR